MLYKYTYLYLYLNNIFDGQAAPVTTEEAYGKNTDHLAALGDMHVLKAGGIR